MELRVMIGNGEIGRLREESGKCYFAYSTEWMEHGFSISPRSLPLGDRLFTGRRDRFEGLFGVFADSLPGGWGMLTAVKTLWKRGISYFDLNPLEKLTYIGDGGLGALSYVPSECDWEYGDVDDLDRLCSECMTVAEEDDGNLDEIFRRAGSTGGARPKINLRSGKEDWIVKVRERNDPPSIGRMEYEYNLAAKACGIDVPDVRLMDSDICDGYFASRRFDRIGDTRIHMISLGGLLEVPSDMPLLDYISFLQATRYITGSQREVVKAFRLSCFNILAGNCDDHLKNFSYLYDPERQRYILSPAYDLTRTPGMKEHHMTCMGNPMPGKVELMALADRMNIRKRDAQEIIDLTEDVVSENLREWL